MSNKLTLDSLIISAKEIEKEVEKLKMRSCIVVAFGLIDFYDCYPDCAIYLSSDENLDGLDVEVRLGGVTHDELTSKMSKLMNVVPLPVNVGYAFGGEKTKYRKADLPYIIGELGLSYADLFATYEKEKLKNLSQVVGLDMVKKNKVL